MKKTVFLVVALFALVLVVKYLDQEAALKKTSLVIDSKKLTAFTVFDGSNRYTVKKEAVWAFDDSHSDEKIRVISKRVYHRVSD